MALKYVIKKKPIIFAGVGIVGFLVDLAICISLEDYVGYLAARITSFSVSTCITYWLNSWYTFEAKYRISIKSFMIYLIGIATSAALNIGSSAAIYNWTSGFAYQTAISVAIGCIVGMFTNYHYHSKVTFNAT